MDVTLSDKSCQFLIIDHIFLHGWYYILHMFLKWNYLIVHILAVFTKCRVRVSPSRCCSHLLSPFYPLACPHVSAIVVPLVVGNTICVMQQCNCHCRCHFRWTHVSTTGKKARLGEREKALKILQGKVLRMGGNVRKLGVAAVWRKEVSCRSAIVQLCGEQVVLWRPLVPRRANGGGQG